MSEIVKHECGIVLIRLLKPLEYYHLKYGSWMYGLQKLYLLMEKQHNRGQDGAGVATLKFDMPPGNKYFHRCRSNANSPIKDVFDQVNARHNASSGGNVELMKDVEWAKANLDFSGELFIGHLRYGTFGRNNIENVHPVMRQNNWKSRNLVLAGNFNLTNVNELFNLLVGLGQHPKDYSDTVTILEKIGHFLDRENQVQFDKYKKQGLSNTDISELISKDLDVSNILKEASKKWDGGYVIAGMMGHGDSFVLRDPSGIRPCSYYKDDEIVVVASERPVIQTVMNVDADQINDLTPGNALIIKKNGDVSEKEINKPLKRRSCSFERIYFSRGSDKDIYLERKRLGNYLVPSILKVINNDLDNTVFSFIPNTAEVAFYGLYHGLENYLKEQKKRAILECDDLDDEKLEDILDHRPRVEKIAIKDAKLRTFISDDSGRNDLVGHVYDVTYGVVRRGIDTLVVIDDSIVRGTTLKQSILRILDRIGPKKIVVVSSAPQIRYPDCYGIDMAKLGDFVAFEAAIELLKDTGRKNIINEVYNKCKEQSGFAKEDIVNYVKDIYKPFTAVQISKKIAEILTPKDIKAEVNIIYQTIEDLHKACPNDRGDWYFTGDYPTPGGNKVVNQSFINYIEGSNLRAY